MYKLYFTSTGNDKFLRKSELGAPSCLKTEGSGTEHFPLEKRVPADSASYTEVLLTAYNSVLKFKNLGI